MIITSASGIITFDNDLITCEVGLEMFDKCIPCERLGEDCVPNLMLLSFADLMSWCNKRQKYLGWTNAVLAERSRVPLGTINRIKAGDYMDCKYSTIRNILVALIGGISTEFPCKEKLEQVLQQANKLEATETENRELCELVRKMDELHRSDIRMIREEYAEQVAFLKEQLRAWQRKER